MTSVPARQAVAARGLDWGLLLLLPLLACFAAFLAWRFAPAIVDPDDNGYFAQGTLIQATGGSTFRPQSDAQYLGMHWLLTAEGELMSRYPPGLALVIAGWVYLAGPESAVAVNAALAVLTLIGFYLLARGVVSSGWALAGVAALALTPTFVRHALSGDAHVAVTCALAWGVFFLWLWSEQVKAWQAFAAGLILGCIPAIRYPDAVVGIGVGLFFLLNCRRWPRIGWHYLAALLGAGIPIGLLLFRNHLVLGAFWRTGYSLTHEQTGFGWSYFMDHSVDYLKSLGSSGVGLYLGLGLAGILALCFTPPRRSFGLLLLWGVVSLLLLYMAYYWAPQGMAGATLRFILPLFPLLILGGLWTLSKLPPTTSSPRLVAVALGLALVGVQLAWNGTDIWNQTRQSQHQKEVLAQVSAALAEVAQPGDVILAGPGLLQHLDFLRRWKLADPTAMSGGGPMAMMMRPGGAEEEAPSPMQAAKARQQREKYPGSATEKRAKFQADLRAWAGTGRVFVVGSERELRGTLAPGAKGEELRIVRRVPLPEAPKAEPRRRGMGGLPGMGGGPPGMAGPPGMPGGGPPGMGGGPVGMAGPGGMRPPGGPMGMGFLAGEKEAVIAVWTLPGK